MYRVNWKNGMNLVNGLYLVNEVRGVNGVICLVNSDNERDSVLLNRFHLFRGGNLFLEGLAIISRTRLSNNRSVMPLDVLGRTRATLNESASFSLIERYG